MVVSAQNWLELRMITLETQSAKSLYFWSDTSIFLVTFRCDC